MNKNILELWEQSYYQVDNIYQKMKELFDLSPESQFSLCIFGPFENYTQSLQILWNTTMLEWYVWENDMGKKGHLAGFDENMKPIRNLDDLMEIIQEENRRS